MYCGNCGAENPDNARFCRGCGRELRKPIPEGPRRGPRIAAAVVGLAALAAVAAALLWLKPWHWLDSGSEGAPLSVEETLERMAEANGGELPDVYYDEGDLTPRFVLGCYTKRTIRSADDAVASLEDVAPLYGFANPQEEFEVVSSSELDGGFVYRLQQRYEGLEVYGNQLVVSCDDEGKTASLSGDYLADISLDLTEPVEVDEGFAMAVWEGEEGPEVVLKRENGWGVTLYSADTREVVYRQEAVETVSLRFDDEKVGNERLSFTVERDGDSSYALNNRTRNLIVFDAEDRELTADRYLKDGRVQCGTYGTGSYLWYGAAIPVDSVLDHDDVFLSADGTYTARKDGITVDGLQEESLADSSNANIVWFDDAMDGVSTAAIQSQQDWKSGGRTANGVRALSYVTKTYDFYRSHCAGWRGYDGKNGLFRIVVNNHMGGEDNAWSCGNIITFSTSAGVDATTTAHEYTHSVMGAVMDGGVLLNLPETGSLKEAYADIMAAIIMEPDTWVLSDRNLADPSKSKLDESGDGKLQHPSTYEGTYWYFLGTEQASASNDYGGKHQNSTVIGHAAYLMHEKGISAEMLGRIWFGSMYYLDPRSDFYGCRYAVLAAAKALGCSSELMDAIDAAFYEVGIGDFDVSTMRVAPDAKVYAEDAIGYRIEDFELQLRYAGTEFGTNCGKVACKASSENGCVDMKQAFGGEPLVGRYWFDVRAENSEQRMTPPITVSADGAKELVVTLPVLVAALDPEPDFELGPYAAINFVRTWYDDWSFDGTHEVRSSKTVEERCLPLIDEQSDLYTKFSEGFEKGAIETCVLADPTATETAQNVYRVTVWYTSHNESNVGQREIDASTFDFLSTSRRHQVAWDVTLNDQGLVTAISRASGGPYTLTGWIHKHTEDVYGESVTVVSMTLDESVDYTYEYKGTIDATAHEVELESSLSDTFGQWMPYDGQHLTVECDSLHGAIHDASMRGVDTLAMGEIRLIHVDESELAEGNGAESNNTIYLEDCQIIESDSYQGNQGDSFIDVLGTNENTRGRTDVDGNVYDHGIEAWIARWNYTDEVSWAYATFDIGGKYKKLSGKVVLIDSYNTNDFDTTLNFYGNENHIKGFQLLPNQIPFEFEIDIEGADSLTIEVGDNVAKSGGTSFGLVDCKLSK